MSSSSSASWPTPSRASSTSAEAFFVKHLTGPLGDVMTALAEFKNEIVAVAGVAITLGAAFKGVRGVITLMRRGRGPRGPAVTGAPAAGAATAAGAAAAAAAGTGTAQQRPRLRDAFARRAGMMNRIPGVGLVVGGVLLAEAATRGDSDTFVDEAAGIGGSLGGAALGAAAGTAIAPGVGTVVGGIAGAIAGDVAARELVDWFQDRFSADPAPGVLEPATDEHLLARQRVMAAIRAERQSEVAALAPSLAPAHPAHRRGGGVYTDNSRIHITVNSKSDEPRVVADEVITALERKQRDRRRLIDDAIMVDDTTELYF